MCLGNDLCSLTPYELRSYYNYPTYTINAVDTILARLITSLSRELNEDVHSGFINTLNDPSLSVIDYLVNMTDRYLNIEIN